jgi:hypothetical protein
MTVNLTGEKLEEIGQRAFAKCAVETTEDYAFYGCSSLTTDKILGEGLEEIGEEAFLGYRSLHEILIPPTVKG